MLRIVSATFFACTLVACTEPCKEDGDCGLGSYCLYDYYSDAIIPEGQCVQECVTSADCAAVEVDPGAIAICTNEGRCGAATVPDLIRLRDPETDTIYPDGTRTMRIHGELKTAADSARIEIGVITTKGCGGTRVLDPIVVTNPTPHTRASVPFTSTEIAVDPGTAIVEVRAPGAETEVATIEVACPGCPEISVAPLASAIVPDLVLPAIEGYVPANIEYGTWRVHGAAGEVFDGLFAAEAGYFSLEQLPLFGGSNRVEILAADPSGSSPFGRCSSWVTSGVGDERGLRVVLQWDGEGADLDVAVVVPHGRFRDPATSLSASNANPVYGGVVIPSASDRSAEVARIEEATDGVYGVIVEPMTGGRGGGGDARLRVLYDGQLLERGPIGPRHVSARNRELWIAGAIEVRDGSASWIDVDRLQRDRPRDPPEAWIGR